MVNAKVSLPKRSQRKSVVAASNKQATNHTTPINEHQVSSTTATEPTFVHSDVDELNPLVQLPAAGRKPRRVAPRNSLYTVRESWLAPYDHRMAHDTRLHYQPWTIAIGNHYDNGDDLEDNNAQPTPTTTHKMQKPRDGWSNPSRTAEPDVAQWDVDLSVFNEPSPPVLSVKQLEHQFSNQTVYSPTSPLPLQVFRPESHDVHKFPLLTRFSPPPHYVPA
ncbi:hypothetical protein FRC03_002846 [Tulasnella sp. 419]|nr:hypothetical protein FRC03_002846 [Tulasnella sp. 419]